MTFQATRPPDFHAPTPSRRGTMLAKIRGERVERIPFATYNLHPFGPHARDASYAPLLEVVERTAGILVKHSLRRVSSEPDRREISREHRPGLTRTTIRWHTPKGELRSVSEKPAGQPAYTVEPFIKSDDDIARVLSVPHARCHFDLTETHRLLEAIGERGVLYVHYPDPMYAAAHLFCFEEFAIRCLTDADRIQELVDYFAEGINAEIEGMAAACAGLPLLFFTVGPEVATPPMLPPSLFARFVTPYQKRIIRIFHAHGHSVCIHCHGRVRQVLDEMLETGADALEPIEPPAQGDISLTELQARVAGRLCLIGYIQDQEFYQARPGEMRARVAEIAAMLRPDARYIMTPTCTPFQYPVSPGYAAAYKEWLEAAAERFG